MEFPSPRFTQGYAAAWTQLSPELRGIILMCLSSTGFALMHVMIRHATTEIHAMQIAFFRNFLGFIVFLPIIMTRGAGFLRTKRLRLHGLRGIVNIGAMLMFFYALSIAPVAHVTALGFSAPIFAGILSVLFLGERIRLRRWSAIFFGFIGVIVILRPGAIPIDLGSVLVLSSAFLWAVTLMIIKVMSRTESSLTIAAYMNIFLSVLSLGPAIWFWTWPSAEGWMWLALIAVTGTLAQIAVSQSLKEAEPTAVMPYDFLRLVWVAILGAWIFGEIPDVWTWVGAAIVFVSGCYLAYRESVARKREAAVLDDGPLTGRQ